MAANTANKRVLVTNKDGSQSVQTVESELGLKAGDIDGIRCPLHVPPLNSNERLTGGELCCVGVVWRSKE
jgi:hypothetical protein